MIGRLDGLLYEGYYSRNLMIYEGSFYISACALCEYPGEAS
jgi:hypothetical protein